MSHKLKPNDLTTLLLKSNFEFSWGLGKDRLLKFDIFVNELKSKFCVVDWSQSNKADVTLATLEAEKAKIELMSLCAGPQLRDVINSLISEKPISFEEIVKLTRKKLMKNTPPLLLLTTLLSESQGFTESFENYYDRVQVSANSIDWDSFTPENIKKALIATTFASRSLNPFVKGHCLALRDMSSINLQDMLNTAHEYEEKNPTPASFPQVGHSGSLFAPSGAGGGLFGAAPVGNRDGSLKEAKPRVKCTHHYRYDKDGNLDPSSTNSGVFRGFSFNAPKPGGTSLFGSSPCQVVPVPSPAPGVAPSGKSAPGGMFGAPPFSSAPFGGFKNNIFMSEGQGAKEEEAGRSEEPSAEGEGLAVKRVKRHRSDAGPSDKAP